MASLKYISNFWRTIEIPFIHWKIYLDLNRHKNCAIVPTTVAYQGVTFSITATKLYVPVVSSSTQDNALFEQLKSGFKRTVKWTIRLLNWSKFWRSK